MTSPLPVASSDMVFRRQFFLGAQDPYFLADWTHHRINATLTLSVHPDLPLTSASVGDRSLHLLGYVLDPRHPHLDDQSVVDDVLHHGTTLDRLLTAFHPLAGRWAAIFVDHGELVAFHDTTGSRQIYFCRDAGGAVALASSPGLLARATERQQDVQALRQLERDGLFRTGLTHSWPGSGSAFVGVCRLLPNHYLDVATGEALRFWPTSPIRQLDADEAASLSISTITGAITAASARYPLALALTAGLDSRLLLAASRELASGIMFYSYKKPGMNSLSPDIRLPRKMSQDLDLRHKVITVRSESDPRVRSAMAASVLPIHATIASQATALLADPPTPDGNWVTLNGNVAEVAQHRLRRLPVTPENLAQNGRMPGSSYAMEHLAAWHDSNRRQFDLTGVDPWDLLYWEHRMGGWYSTVRTEFDVVEEVVTPYNSRAWLEGMLGVDPTLRSEPEYPFFRNLIQQLWPQLLDYPVNPPDRVGLLAKRARSVAGRIASTTSRRRQVASRTRGPAPSRGS